MRHTPGQTTMSGASPGEVGDEALFQDVYTGIYDGCFFYDGFNFAGK